MLSDHALHLLLLLIPTFLCLLLFREHLQTAFHSSLKKGLINVLVILLLVNFGLSQPLMVFHQNHPADHFCCIIQPSLGSVANIVLPVSPPPSKLVAIPEPLPTKLVGLLPHFSRAPPLS